jgi:hypothetical protein
MALKSKTNPQTTHNPTFTAIKIHKVDSQGLPDRRKDILYHALSNTDGADISLSSELVTNWREWL